MTEPWVASQAHNQRGPLSWRPLIVIAMASVLVTVTAFTVWGPLRRHTVPGIGSRAYVTASGIAPGSSLPAVVDGSLTEGSGNGWITSGSPVGAWINLNWSRAYRVRRILLERGPLNRPGLVAGYLTFGDGSRVAVTLSKTSTITVLPITPRSMSSLTFTVTAVSSGARDGGLRRIRVLDSPAAGDVATAAQGDGDVASAASVSSSQPSEAGNLRALVDGEGPGRTGAVWDTDHAAGTTLTMSWSRPRELDMIAVAGTDSAARLLAATVEFSDGSSLVLGAVLADPDQPTLMAFMPRVTSSVRLTFTRESGPGRLALAEISAYRIGASPQSALVASNPSPPAATPACGPPSARPTDAQGLVVQCPTDASVVGSSAPLQIKLAPSYQSVQATILPANAGVAVPPAVEATASAGELATVDLDTSSLPAGPFTVDLEATSASQPTKSVLFQLDKEGVPRSTSAASPSPATGRTMVYSEDFDQPVSISRTGADADFAGSKPEVSTVVDFGDAIFADPSAGLGNEQVIDDQYLQISVSPRPADFPDPGGFGRQYVGGLLSSARPGGSGFSAQYGYFEARMLAPAAPGTWPAFWMLSNPNLIAPEPHVAEIDAVELHGQFPTKSCESTHGYVNNADTGIADCATRWTSTTQALQWHTYGVSVDPTRILFYIDNRLVATAPQVGGGSDPLFFMADLALGGGFPDDLSALGGRAALYVDYVRVYE